MTSLLTFYRWNRHHAAGRAYPRKAGPNPAAEALAAARDDVAALKAAKAHLETCAALKDSDPSPDNVAAYQAALKATTRARRYLPESPCLTWQSDATGAAARRGERLAHINRPEAFGLRLVGRVTPESYGGRDTWDSRESCGWHTCPYGDVFKDGTGLCYGLVYQLPARNGRARFVAGYEFGGCDGGPTLDLGNVYEGERGDNCSYDGAPGNPAARDAARAADSMAQRAAESEREYQTAWQLGRTYDDARQEASDARAAARELLAERRQAKADAGGNAPAICRAIRDSVAGHLETIRAARETMRNALAGDGPGLCVYMGERAQEAFCEGAGLGSFPA